MTLPDTLPGPAPHRALAKAAAHFRDVVQVAADLHATCPLCHGWRSLTLTVQGNRLAAVPHGCLEAHDERAIWEAVGLALTDLVLPTLTVVPVGVPDVTHLGEPWPPPFRFDARRLPPFPIHALPPWWRGYLEAVANSTATPLELVGNHALPIVASTVQRKYVVRALGGHREPLCLWTLQPMDSGERKSQVHRRLIEILEELQIEMLADHDARYREQAIIHDSDLKRVEILKTKAARENDANARRALQIEAAELLTRCETQKPPWPPNTIAAEFTAEALRDTLEGQGQVLVASPEGDLFETILGRYDKNGTPNFGIWLAGHAGDSFYADRVGRRICLQNPAISMAVATQPVVLKRLLSDQGFVRQGMMPRFLPCMPPSRLGHRPARLPEIPEDVTAAWQHALRLLSAIPIQRQNGQIRERPLAFSADAETLLEEFFNRNEYRLREGRLLSGVLKAWGSKLYGQLVRLAAILHCAERIRPDLSADMQRIHTEPISADTTERAFAFDGFYVAHGLAAWSEMGIDVDGENARIVWRAIERALRKSPGTWELPDQQIWQLARNAHDFQRKAEVDEALQVLCERFYLRRLTPSEKQTRPGRPAGPVFAINPLLFVDAEEASAS